VLAGNTAMCGVHNVSIRPYPARGPADSGQELASFVRGGAIVTCALDRIQRRLTLNNGFAGKLLHQAAGRNLRPPTSLRFENPGQGEYPHTRTAWWPWGVFQTFKNNRNKPVLCRGPALRGMVVGTRLPAAGERREHLRHSLRPGAAESSGLGRERV